jgi:hypothetical protein
VHERFSIPIDWKSFLVWSAMTVVWLVDVKKQIRRSISVFYQMSCSLFNFSCVATSYLHSRACKTRNCSDVMVGKFGGWLMVSVDVCEATIRP